MRVVFVSAILTHYRVPFHERARSLLKAKGVDYNLIYGQPIGSEVKKGDTASLNWASFVRNRPFTVGGRQILWQPVLGRLRGGDLVIIGQENRLVINYLLQSFPAGLRPRIALWGHGRNVQSRSPDGPLEIWKRYWAKKCDWWFAYTQETKLHIEGLGFPGSRITVFNNSVDTTEIRRLADAVTPTRLAELRRETAIVGQHVGIFVGGLYSEKRLEFLIEACDYIRDIIHDFELIIVGSGPDAERLHTQSLTRPWLKLTGARFGAEKVEFMRLGQILLMPGLVGLAILDGGAVGLPMVTTAYPYHSPEIAYLEHGENGLIVTQWREPKAYGEAVASLFKNPALLNAMTSKARQVADSLGIERMTDRFASGVLSALREDKR
jgi:glycosyltransferase involved in cell wall biosynthesis